MASLTQMTLFIIPSLWCMVQNSAKTLAEVDDWLCLVKNPYWRHCGAQSTKTSPKIWPQYREKEKPLFKSSLYLNRFCWRSIHMQCCALSYLQALGFLCSKYWNRHNLNPNWESKLCQFDILPSAMLLKQPHHICPTGLSHLSDVHQKSVWLTPSFNDTESTLGAKATQEEDHSSRVGPLKRRATEFGGGRSSQHMFIKKALQWLTQWFPRGLPCCVFYAQKLILSIAPSGWKLTVQSVIISCSVTYHTTVTCL